MKDICYARSDEECDGVGQTLPPKDEPIFAPPEDFKRVSATPDQIELAHQTLANMVSGVDTQWEIREAVAPSGDLVVELGWLGSAPRWNQMTPTKARELATRLVQAADELEKREAALRPKLADLQAAREMIAQLEAEIAAVKAGVKE